MNFFSAVAGIFGGGSSTLENIATEWIQTEKESAEAKAVMVKALDPNGKMRHDLSRRVAALYTFYLTTMSALLICEFFGFIPTGQSQESIQVVTDKFVSLFVPITGLFGAIVTASFGVNYANVKQNK